MKIECILKRPGGSKVEIDGTEYHFEPLPDGAHVADVTEKAHIGRFLSIAEAYQLYDAEPEKAPSEEVKSGSEAKADGDENPPAVTLDDLREQYKAKFGKAAHHNMTAETIAKKLAE